MLIPSNGINVHVKTKAMLKCFDAKGVAQNWLYSPARQGQYFTALNLVLKKILVHCSVTKLGKSSQRWAKLKAKFYSQTAAIFRFLTKIERLFNI